MNRDSFRALEQYQSAAANADKRPTGVERMLGGVAARTPQLPKQNSVNPGVDQVDCTNSLHSGLSSSADCIVAETQLVS